MDLGAIAQLGDCEAIGGGWFRQPVSAWSSLAFVVVGTGIAAGTRTAMGREKTDRIVFGLLLVATGAGSFLFHGPQPAGGEFLHDVTFLAAVWFLIAANVTGAEKISRHITAVIAIGGIAGIAILLAIAGSATNIITAVLAVALIGSDLVLWRHAAPVPVWYGTAIALLVVGVGLFVAGRTGSPLCDPDGLLQAHGGWHVFAALFLGLYFLATEPARTGGALR